MPVTIVDNNSATSTSNGTIQIGDLQAMTLEYIDKVALTALPPRTVVNKRNSFYFTRDQVTDLFKHFEGRPEADAIEIAIGVQIPGSKVKCEHDPVEKDNSDCLGVIVSMVNRDLLRPYHNIGDYVLINGYHSPIELKDAGMCCPGSKPPQN